MSFKVDNPCALWVRLIVWGERLFFHGRWQWLMFKVARLEWKNRHERNDYYGLGRD